MEKIRINLDGLSEISFDLMQRSTKKAEALNANEGDLKGYDCRICRNRGTVYHVRDDGSLYGVMCSCQPLRRCIRRIEESGLKKSIDDLTFDTFQVTQPWQEVLKSGVQEYARQLKGWLLLCGQSGSGKTHLCTALCGKELKSGKPVSYLPWRDTVAELKALSLDSDRRARLMEEFKNAPLLYIDDLFKTGRSRDGSDLPTGADVSIAFELLNYRYNNRLPTVISSERTPQELVQIDEATGSRIIELAGNHVYSIARDIRRNYRLRGIREL